MTIACGMKLALCSVPPRIRPRLAQVMRFNMVRSTALIVGIFGGLYWSGLIDIESDHLKWFCIPFAAYLGGMILLFHDPAR
jgi:hypothetical protein